MRFPKKPIRMINPTRKKIDSTCIIKYPLFFPVHTTGD
jgi:hypothetical protein